ncbi:MAG TPA: hypothetical protein VMF88_12550 [Bacteroidota bacterium]|nr:hypothetical protein [Bacteroidota bacterium]
MAPGEFFYRPDEYESERASNSYLMSLVVIMAGLPLPIVNVIASAIFYFANRKSAYFVRWHCTQTLLAQLFTLPVNAAGLYWTLGIIFDRTTISNGYVSYLLTIILFNLAEFIATIHAASRTRKGNHVVWWFFGPLTEMLVKA